MSDPTEPVYKQACSIIGLTVVRSPVSQTFALNSCKTADVVPIMFFEERSTILVVTSLYEGPMGSGS